MAWAHAGPGVLASALASLGGLALLLAWEAARRQKGLGGAEERQPKAKQPPKRKVRPPVTITDEDRVPPVRPVVRALRPGSDHREDPSALIRCEPQPTHSACRTAILVLPGGNYDECSLRFPLRVASWLTELGLVAFVLRYRLRSEGHYWPAQEEDCREALRVIRKDAAFAIGRFDAVGVIGFSAGGHLASVAATTFETGLRPDFHVLVYATTNVETPLWDPWKARFGYPGPWTNTCEKVSGSTPPLFAAVSREDDVTSYEENTAPYVEACRRAGVPAELVLASMGPHGHPMVDAWTKPCEQWLRRNGWAAERGSGPPGGP